MIDRFDHAVIAVPDLEGATAAYRELGFTVQPGGRHTGEGTHNALVRFGLDYLELMAVRDEREARRRPFGSQLLDLLQRGRRGLIGYVVAGRNLDDLALRMKQAGLHAMGPVDMQRQRPDGRLVQWRLLFPRGQRWGDIAPFVIEWGADDLVRLSEATDRHPNGALRVDGLTIKATDLAGARELYDRTLGLKSVAVTATSARVTLGTVSIDLTSTDTGAQGWTAILPDGEGVLELRLAVRDIKVALATIPGLSPGTDGLYRIPPDAALGARIAVKEV